MNSNSYDIWDVNSAANKLIGQAHTISARHIKNASTRMQFNREVSYYAKRIADDVALGHKTPEQGIQTILQEQRDLLNQSIALTRHAPIPSAVKRLSLMSITQPIYRADPERLLRFVHAQNLTTKRNSQNAAKPPPAQRPSPDLKFFPRERWPEPRPQPQEPGFYIVPKSTSAEELEARLFPSANPAVIAKFKALNPNLGQVKAGQLIVLSGGLATLACGILVVGTGSFASGAIGGILGEEIGEVVYETTK